MKKISVFILSSLFLFSCNKFLDYQPDDRTELDNVVKITELVGSAYPDRFYAAFAESMSDNAGDKGVTSREMKNFYPWEFRDQVSTASDTPNAYWQACYRAIAAANQALAGIAKLGDPVEARAAKGEALVARAYAHFMLVNYFALPYDSSIANDSPGIPYQTTPETVAVGEYSRGTVQSVYDMIEKDLLDGIPLIDNSTYKVPSFHFTKNAAYAFATRFYLFKKEYERVIFYADLISNTTSIANLLRPWNTAYQNYSYFVLQDAYSSSSDPANILMAESASGYGEDYPRYNYGLNSSLLATVFGGGSNPLNLQLSYRSKVFGGNETVYNIPKFKTNFIKEAISDNFGIRYVVYTLFSMEEVLFNRAEAYANLDRTIDALADLQAFLSKRVTNYNVNNANHRITLAKCQAFYPGLTDKEAVVETILNFKRQEFLFEGMRWFDIIRTGKTVIHRSVAGSRDQIDLTISPDDPKRVLQLPIEAIEYGLQANPRN
ncbi:RagB/SusD family nutrient uptake outer membrane protein [Sphingobacterium rhinopitheci]|uniref:RagB/SusD family nutrient uptake outer membrane protein n=1 Tax=Sphingobacterium rhinopitheci TaxID=2781960 RepID=UPI001F519CB5|nr:RagB/SusD family nutrient uptake outer membrane protein [Sphingobacterium rhinopitheci]MCI0920452.1 RagB/SusD family nutrient uptake outer membrane protein [Sphingobacterium rhinopitheci]